MRKTAFACMALLGLVCSEGLCPNERKLTIKEEDNKVKIDSDTRDKKAKCKDSLAITFETNEDGARVAFDYKAKNGSAKARFKVKQAVYEVVEFNDTNNDNSIAPDEIIQSLSLDKKDEWDKIEVTSKEVDGKELEEMRASYGKWFTVVGRYSGAFVTYLSKNANNTKEIEYELNPLAIKIDYIIDNFPYKANGTKLAIKGRFQSKAKFHDKRKKASKQRKDEQNEEEIEIEDSEGGARFSWVTSVDADGNSVPVKTYYENENAADTANRKVVWVFDTTEQVKQFIWDPALEANEQGDALSMGTTAAVPFLVGYLLSIFV